MDVVMQDTREMDLSLIPPADIRNLAQTFLDAVTRFYADPVNEARFQEWLRRRAD